MFGVEFYGAGTYGAQLASGAGYSNFSLVNAVCQGSGASISGSFPSAYAPTAVCIAGTTSTPQSAMASFALGSITTSPVQWVDQQFLLPNTLGGNYPFSAVVDFDTATGGTVNVSFQYACAASGTPAAPVLSSVQNFAITVPGVVGNLSYVSGTVTSLSGCSATNLLFTRVGITGSTGSGNVRIHSAKLQVQ